VRSTVLRLLGAVLVALVTVSIALPAQAGTRPGTVLAPAHPPKDRTSTGKAWTARADQAIDRAIAADTGTGTAFSYSWLASAIAHRHGWDDPRAMHYLQLALDQQHADGGYGLNYAWDAFGDGTVNPASTNYTITYYQVGEVVLEAYKAGKVPYSTVTDIMRALVATPRIPVSVGMGLAYSNSRYDVQPGYMVHNVAQGAALFLKDAQLAGVKWSEAQVNGWIQGLYHQEVSAYHPDLHGWPYRNGGSQAVQDAAHNAIGVAMLVVDDPSMGVPALQWAMSHSLGATGPLAHASLAQFSCSSSARWLGEYDIALASPKFSTFSYLAQFARADALNAHACSRGRDLAPRPFR
jgi:hypothetical protein